ncbi:MAG: hypothetical protein O9282_05295 [Flavobacterium sp.]|jgi:hypothetical protein|uniref:hypothetical protein n=1 Tax=Flavobacterium sp. TaxID=239 RepID=UPI0022C26189|nr:hypothetical protein [Flavobacterium sp.]MCZ8330708.1 hypothetical protein [Flavobacterium sp.]
MKIIKTLFAFAAIFSMNSGSARAIIETWPEIKNYHDLMTKSYKSAKKGDFNPIKNYATTLSKDAEKLCIENMPQNFRQPKTIEALVKLKRESKNIHELLENNATNNEIFETLKSIHLTFKKMSDLCCQKK